MSDKKNSSRKLVRKAHGTRFGTVDNWREASHPAGKRTDRYGRAVRDGR